MGLLEFILMFRLRVIQFVSNFKHRISIIASATTSSVLKEVISEPEAVSTIPDIPIFSELSQTFVIIPTHSNELVIVPTYSPELQNAYKSNLFNSYHRDKIYVFSVIALIVFMVVCPFVSFYLDLFYRRVRKVLPFLRPDNEFKSYKVLYAYVPGIDYFGESALACVQDVDFETSPHIIFPLSALMQIYEVPVSHPVIQNDPCHSPLDLIILFQQVLGICVIGYTSCLSALISCFIVFNNFVSDTIRSIQDIIQEVKWYFSIWKDILISKRIRVACYNVLLFNTGIGALLLELITSLSSLLLNPLSVSKLIDDSLLGIQHYNVPVTLAVILFLREPIIIKICDSFVYNLVRRTKSIFHLMDFSFATVVLYLALALLHVFSFNILRNNKLCSPYELQYETVRAELYHLPVIVLIIFIKRQSFVIGNYMTEIKNSIQATYCIFQGNNT